MRIPQTFRSALSALFTSAGARACQTMPGVFAGVESSWVARGSPVVCVSWPHTHGARCQKRASLHQRARGRLSQYMLLDILLAYYRCATCEACTVWEKPPARACVVIHAYYLCVIHTHTHSHALSLHPRHSDRVGVDVRACVCTFLRGMLICIIDMHRNFMRRFTALSADWRRRQRRRRRALTPRPPVASVLHPPQPPRPPTYWCRGRRHT